MKNIWVLSGLVEGIRDTRSRDLLVTAASNGVSKQQFRQILLTSLMQFRFVSFAPKRLNVAAFPQNFYLPPLRFSTDAFRVPKPNYPPM